MFHLLVYSPNVCHSQGWTRLKPDLRIPPGSLSYEWQGPQNLSHHPLPPRMCKQEAVTKVKGSGLKEALGCVQGWNVFISGFTCYTTRPDLNVSYLNSKISWIGLTCLN